MFPAPEISSYNYIMVPLINISQQICCNEKMYQIKLRYPGIPFVSEQELGEDITSPPYIETELTNNTKYSIKQIKKTHPYI